jgi:hypothetical protein
LQTFGATEVVATLSTAIGNIDAEGEAETVLVAVVVGAVVVVITAEPDVAGRGLAEADGAAVPHPLIRSAMTGIVRYFFHIGTPRVGKLDHITTYHV